MTQTSVTTFNERPKITREYMTKISLLAEKEVKNKANVESRRQTS